RANPTSHTRQSVARSWRRWTVSALVRGAGVAGAGESHERAAFGSGELARHHRVSIVLNVDQNVSVTARPTNSHGRRTRPQMRLAHQTKRKKSRLAEVLFAHP